MNALQVLKTVGIILFGLPIPGYAGLLGYQMAHAWMKYGWDSRPFVSMGIDSIIVFFVYGLLYIQAVGMGATLQSIGKCQRGCYWVVYASLSFCWLGILTSGIRLLSR